MRDSNKIVNLNVKIAGENEHHGDKREIPTHEKEAAVVKLAGEVPDIWWHELLLKLAAYFGPRFGEICDLHLTK